MTETPERTSAESEASIPAEPPIRELSDAAKRALAEAEERRRARDATETQEAGQREVGGRTGPDPVRYGDWEKDGIISDF